MAGGSNRTPLFINPLVITYISIISENQSIFNFLAKLRPYKYYVSCFIFEGVYNWNNGEGGGEGKGFAEPSSGIRGWELKSTRHSIHKLNMVTTPKLNYKVAEIRGGVRIAIFKGEYFPSKTLRVNRVP